MTPRLRLRSARRRSSSRFSDVIRTDNIWLIGSWSDQRSSNGIASKSIFFIDIRQPFIWDFDLVRLMSYNQVSRSARGSRPEPPKFGPELHFGRQATS